MLYTNCKGGVHRNTSLLQLHPMPVQPRLMHASGAQEEIAHHVACYMYNYNIIIVNIIVQLIVIND